jgi:hypothetical protein
MRDSSDILLGMASVRFHQGTPQQTPPPGVAKDLAFGEENGKDHLSSVTHALVRVRHVA